MLGGVSDLLAHRELEPFEAPVCCIYNVRVFFVAKRQC